MKHPQPAPPAPESRRHCTPRSTSCRRSQNIKTDNRNYIHDAPKPVPDGRDHETPVELVLDDC
jgi:hypothetical protein